MRFSPVLPLLLVLLASPSYAQETTPTDESTTQDLDVETVEEIAIETKVEVDAKVDVDVEVEVDAAETSDAVLVEEKEEKVSPKRMEKMRLWSTTVA